MALSEDQIIDLFNEACRETFNGLERFRYFARAIEAEVQKQDTALIRQMKEALETCDESDGYTGLRQFFDDKAVEAAITARRAGGACPQSRGSD